MIYYKAVRAIMQVQGRRVKGNASGRFFNTPRKNWYYSTRTAKDGIAKKCTSLYIFWLRVFLMKNSILFGTTDFLSVQRCFVHTQNSPSTVVHGCTTVEDGSNGLTVSIFSQFLSTLPDAFTHLPEKFRTKRQQPPRICIMRKPWYLATVGMNQLPVRLLG